MDSEPRPKPAPDSDDSSRPRPAEGGRAQDEFTRSGSDRASNVPEIENDDTPDFIDLPPDIEDEQETTDETSGDDEDDASDDEDSSPKYMAFDQDDAGLISILSTAIRRLLRRQTSSPDQIVALGRLIYGLERLPYPTPGLNVKLDLVYSFNGESLFQGIHLTEDELRLGSGGYVQGDYGGDSYSAEELVVTMDDRDDQNALGWIHSFAERCIDKEFQIRTEDESGADLSLHDEIDDPWEDLFED